jgi:hypothetical protein
MIGPCSGDCSGLAFRIKLLEIRRLYDLSVWACCFHLEKECRFLGSHKSYFSTPHRASDEQDQVERGH